MIDEPMPLYEKIAMIYRGAGIAVLYLIWANSGRALAGLFLLMLIMILMLLRWRFPMLKWTLPADQLAIIIGAVFMENSDYALTLSVFEAIYLGHPHFVLPAVVYVAFYRPEGFLWLLLAQSAVAGLGLWGWRRQRDEALKRIDSDSKRYYEVESLKRELLEANVHVARMAELSERSRIAREIHDHAGHEIVAAYMTLQTAQAHRKTDADEAEELFDEAMKRLEAGIDKVRETVHNLSPLADIGAEGLQKICQEFTLAPAQFSMYGDSSKVPVYLWVILEACLKEALTNVLRHAEATSVHATLDIASHIVRLCVENDGVTKDKGHVSAGLGIRNLQQRANGAGGNVSVESSDHFRLICVLPIN